MKVALLLGAAVGLLVVGCSSEPPPYEPRPGTLVPGTAQITVNDQDLGSTEAVQCVPAGTLTTLSTGNQTSGITAMVSNENELETKFVRIKDLGGFTGSYNLGLDGEATVTMTGRTYDISGTAAGFDTDAPSFRTTGTFAIKLAC